MGGVVVTVGDGRGDEVGRMARVGSGVAVEIMVCVEGSEIGVWAMTCVGGSEIMVGALTCVGRVLADEHDASSTPKSR